VCFRLPRGQISRGFFGEGRKTHRQAFPNLNVEIFEADMIHTHVPETMGLLYLYLHGIPLIFKRVKGKQISSWWGFNPF